MTGEAVPGLTGDRVSRRHQLPDQVAAYAYGAQTVIIPYAKLREIAKPGGALTRMMK